MFCALPLIPQTDSASRKSTRHIVDRTAKSRIVIGCFVIRPRVAGAYLSVVIKQFRRCHIFVKASILVFPKIFAGADLIVVDCLLIASRWVNLWRLGWPGRVRTGTDGMKVRYGGPGQSPTADLRVRSALLYATELPGHLG
jgi:hypothetical protein